MQSLTGESVSIVRLHNADQSPIFGPHLWICRCMRNHGGGTNASFFAPNDSLMSMPYINQYCCIRSSNALPGNNRYTRTNTAPAPLSRPRTDIHDHGTHSNPGRQNHPRPQGSIRLNRHSLRRLPSPLRKTSYKLHQTLHHPTTRQTSTKHAAARCVQSASAHPSLASGTVGAIELVENS
jgi:hypothetical protein